MILSSQITGVEIKETVPDRIIELADKIELVDLPIEELIDRLKEGKVYMPEKAKQAMQRFFTEKNLGCFKRNGPQICHRSCGL